MRPPFGIEAMLGMHYVQQWFGPSDSAMEEALHDVPLYREFAKLGSMARLPTRRSCGSATCWSARAGIGHAAGCQRHPAGHGPDDGHRSTPR
jgi:hypothetical protein